MDSLEKTSRFLMQATLGADFDTLKAVSQTGIEQWLDEQLDQTLDASDYFESETSEIWTYFKTRLVNAHGEENINGAGNNPALPYKWYFHMAWWQKTLTDNRHMLRHKIALALSEVLVISDNSSLELDAIGMANYYDLLFNHAFGSYADLLYHVSMHPCMGVYLSHMNNRRADPAQNTHPDENYAREIMQLFTIGLYQLNEDGSVRFNDGTPVPSYDNRDIKELAKVFTGLKASQYQYEWSNDFWPDDFNGREVDFDDGVNPTFKTIPFVNMTKPMEVDESYHDRTSKSLFNGAVSIAANQDAKQEIRDVVNKLVAHPNTAPFIAKKLISLLVTSNPSPRYVRAVAEKFGARGDLRATVIEVLTFPLKNKFSEVLFASALEEQGKLVQSQKLKSPVLRVTQILRAFSASNDSDKLWLIGDDIQRVLKQHPLSSPTVFNFYKPDFTPHGKLSARNLLAPEFELHTSATSIGYVNLMYHWMFSGYLPSVSTVISSVDKNTAELDEERLKDNAQDTLSLNLASYIARAEDSANHDDIIDELSLTLTGRSSSPIKAQIKTSCANYADNAEWVIQTILFLLVISPEFTVLEV